MKGVQHGERMATWALRMCLLLLLVYCDTNDRRRVPEEERAYHMVLNCDWCRGAW